MKNDKYALYTGNIAKNLNQNQEFTLLEVLVLASRVLGLKIVKPIKKQILG